MATFCVKCGAPLSGPFCVKCGANMSNFSALPQPPSPVAQAPQPAAAPTSPGPAPAKQGLNALGEAGHCGRRHYFFGGRCRHRRSVLRCPSGEPEDSPGYR